MIDDLHISRVQPTFFSSACANISSALTCMSSLVGGSATTVASPFAFSEIMRLNVRQAMDDVWRLFYLQRVCPWNFYLWTSWVRSKYLAVKNAKKLPEYGRKLPFTEDGPDASPHSASTWLGSVERTTRNRLEASSMSPAGGRGSEKTRGSLAHGFEVWGDELDGQASRRGCVIYGFGIRV